MENEKTNDGCSRLPARPGHPFSLLRYFAGFFTVKTVNTIQAAGSFAGLAALERPARSPATSPSDRAMAGTI